MLKTFRKEALKPNPKTSLLMQTER